MTTPQRVPETSAVKRKYFGSAGHFICADRCEFHICTLIGDVVISTVGDYRPDREKPYKEIGYNRYFETFVFKSLGPCECGCGMPEIVPTEIDTDGYNDRALANKGHEKMCAKWEKKLASNNRKGATLIRSIEALEAELDKFGQLNTRDTRALIIEVKALRAQLEAGKPDAQPHRFRDLLHG